MNTVYLNLQVKPGLSSFAATPEGAGAAYMRPLLDFARAIVPAEARRSAVLLLRATAGMRLVPPAAAQRIYDTLFDAVRTHGPTLTLTLTDPHPHPNPNQVRAHGPTLTLTLTDPDPDPNADPNPNQVRAHGAFSPTRALFGTLSGEDEGV